MRLGETQVSGGSLRWAGMVLALVATLAAAVQPPAAEAGASANIRRTPGDTAAFTLQGTNGYSLYFKSEKRMLTIVASRGRPGQPTISPDGRLVPRRSGSSSESIYVVHGLDRDPSRIEADLGPVGSLSLVFQPSGEKRVTKIDLDSKSEKCIGAARVDRRLGSFVGTVSFRGENGYTTAAATSVPGTVGTSPFRNCTTLRRRPGGAAAGLATASAGQGAFLTVSGEVSFIANRDKRSAHFYALGSDELSPGFFVLRTATANARSGRFALSRTGLRANLKPPAPFSGTGAYRDPPTGPATWSGNLSVEFPGFVEPLTGPGMTKPRLGQFPESGS
jgi:hypothetical protein